LTVYVATVRNAEGFAYHFGGNMLDKLAQNLTQALSMPLFGFAAAFLAGLISSLAPCTLTAIALVVGYVGGSKAMGRARALASTLAFFLGLTVAFVVLGALAQGLGFLLSGPAFSLALGLLVLLMGMNVAGIISIPMPSATPRAEGRVHAAGAFALGLVTATVSAPCATPVLVAVLALASATAGGSRGVLLTIAYALGHWAPVLVAGITAGTAPQALARSGLTKYSRALTLAMGIALMATGAWLAATNMLKLI